MFAIATWMIQFLHLFADKGKLRVIEQNERLQLILSLLWKCSKYMSTHYHILHKLLLVVCINNAFYERSERGIFPAIFLLKQQYNILWSSHVITLQTLERVQQCHARIRLACPIVGLSTRIPNEWCIKANGFKITQYVTNIPELSL